MDAFFSNVRKLGVVLTLVGMVAVSTASSALADPPNHPRYLPQSPTGLTHEPEILSGFAPPTSTLRPVAAVQPDARGFDWNAAAIGAAGVLGLILLVGSTTLVVLRHRQQASPEATASPALRT